VRRRLCLVRHLLIQRAARAGQLAEAIMTGKNPDAGISLPAGIPRRVLAP